MSNEHVTERGIGRASTRRSAICVGLRSAARPRLGPDARCARGRCGPR
jgi:hypothetical protein